MKPTLLHIFLVIAGAALGAPADLAAETATLELSPASPSSNSFEISLVLNGNAAQPVTDTSTAGGTIEAELNLTTDGRNAIPTGISLTGGMLSFADIGFNIGGILQVDGTGIGGTTSSIVSPSPVTGGEFDAADHELTINQGTFAISGLVTDSFDLSTLPFSGSGSGTGMLTLNEVSRTGNNVEYDVALSIPIAFTDRVLDPAMGSLVALDVRVIGQLDATGRISATIPEPSITSLLFCIATIMSAGALRLRPQ